MRSTILLSSDAKIRHHCSYKIASQLLHLGLARIVKFYPYTLQWKGAQGASGKEPLEGIEVPVTPSDQPPMLHRYLSIPQPVLETGEC